MNATTINLKILNKNHKSIYIPDFLLKKLELKENEQTPIYFGLDHFALARIRSIPSKKQVVYITSALKDQLMIPYPKKIMMVKIGNTIRLGPIIGILTTDLTGKKFSNPVTREKHPFALFFKSLLEPEPLYPAYYFVFTPDYIDWKDNSIKGFFYRPHSKQKNWESIRIPFPDVVYNRVPNRTIERNETIQLFKQKYWLLGGKLFNPDFFNKWDMYEILLKEKNTAKYVPETYQYPTYSTFIQMIEKHPIVYLKPANGSLGLGVYKIVKRKQDYLVHYRYGNQNKTLIFKRIKSMYNHLFTLKNPKRYLIQQGIHLINFEQNPVDFRVQLHKNRSNQWKVVALGAKAAGSGSVTTHLRTGGKLIDANQFLDFKFKNQSQSMKKKIHDVSIQIAETVERNLNQPLGELGLDIGIDQSNRIWLFEVNSKPGRSIFKHPNLKPARLESSKLLLEYAIYLADFLR